MGPLLVFALATAAVGEAGVGLQLGGTRNRPSVSYDRRSLLIEGERVLILSGSVHYTRIHPADWDRVFKLAVELGLNTIQTLVFWSQNEREKGVLDWSGQGNLTRFIRLAQANGLYVAVRVGPYICGEYAWGGLPTWLRNEGAACFRCSDPVWKREMGRFLKLAVREIEPLLLPNGGPVILLQVENEYRGDDLEYLTWAVDTARESTTAVPWFLCHDLASCSAVNGNGMRLWSRPAFHPPALPWAICWGCSCARTCVFR